MSCHVTCHIMTYEHHTLHTCAYHGVHEYHLKLYTFHMICTYAAWSQWQLPPQSPDDGRTAVQDSLLHPTPLHPQDASSFTGRSHEQEEIVMCADDGTNADDMSPSARGRVASDSSLGVPLPPPAPRSLPSTSDNFTPSHRPRSHTIGMAELRRDSTQLDMEQSGTYRRRKVGRQAVRIKKAVVKNLVRVLYDLVFVFLYCKYPIYT